MIFATLLQIHTPSPIYGNDLAGDVRRICNQESNGPGNVIRLTRPFQQGSVDDVLARSFIRPFTRFWPQNGAR
jgi:hypothetical protein